MSFIFKMAIEAWYNMAPDKKLFLGIARTISEGLDDFLRGHTND
jgi:hypothetical protein